MKLVGSPLWWEERLGFLCKKKMQDTSSSISDVVHLKIISISFLKPVFESTYVIGLLILSRACASY